MQLFLLMIVQQKWPKFRHPFRNWFAEYFRETILLRPGHFCMSFATCSGNPAYPKRIRFGFAAYVKRLCGARRAVDPVHLPRSFFDPQKPGSVSTQVALMMLGPLSWSTRRISSTLTGSVTPNRNGVN